MQENPGQGRSIKGSHRPLRSAQDQDCEVIYGGVFYLLGGAGARAPALKIGTQRVSAFSLSAHRGNSDEGFGIAGKSGAMLYGTVPVRQDSAKLKGSAL